jgi:hypothetical protein
LTGTIFLHAHLKAVYYNCVKFQLNPMSRLGGVALTNFESITFDVTYILLGNVVILMYTDETVLVLNNPTLLKTL